MDSISLGTPPQSLGHGNPWFDDGNIILIPDEHENQVAFKVHRGVLSRHSEVFQSMFEIPSSINGETFLEGCQVVRMYDRAVELSILIKALYDGV